MRLRRIISRAGKGLRLTVVTVMVLALVNSGAGAAAQLFAQESAADPAFEFESFANYLVPAPDPDEAAHGMEPGSRPWTEQPARLMSLMLLPVNYESRTQEMTKRFTVTDVARVSCHGRRGLIASACRVDWSLGRQATLVGAKPSGTS